VDWLTEEQVERINETSLDILAGTGVMFEADWAKQMLLRHGCTQGRDADMIRLPRELVADCIAQAPERVQLASLDGSSVHLGSGSPPVYWTGNALYLDEGKTVRPITRADLVDICRVGERLEMIHAIVGPSLADCPPQCRDFAGLRIMAEHTTGHLRPCIYTPRGTVALREMAQVLVGGYRLADRPVLSLGFTAVSPLRWSAIGLDSFRQSSGYGIPIMVNSEPVAGATGPVTPAGALTLANAEALAGVVVVQLLEPGRPTIFNLGFTHTMDMRTTVTRTASPECTLIQSAGAQLARYHGMPGASWANTESMTADGQATAEFTLTALTHALSGVNIIWGVGNLESTRVMSLPQMVIADEMARMVSRIAQGIEVSEETIAADLIARMGTEAQYLGCDHTMAYFRELVEPQLFCTTGREVWGQTGTMTIYEAAEARAEQMLSGEAEILLDDATDAELAAIEQRFTAELVG
jgi:trimethylamine---corrinoid protein Co-methyltransferase